MGYTYNQIIHSAPSHSSWMTKRGLYEELELFFNQKHFNWRLFVGQLLMASLYLSRSQKMMMFSVDFSCAALQDFILSPPPLQMCL